MRHATVKFVLKMEENWKSYTNMTSKCSKQANEIERATVYIRGWGGDLYAITCSNKSDRGLVKGKY